MQLRSEAAIVAVGIASIPHCQDVQPRDCETKAIHIPLAAVILERS